MDDGTASDWGWTFIREFLVKFGLFWVAADILTFGLASTVELLWAFWDRDRQTLHDKTVNTVVVDDLGFLSEARSASPAGAGLKPAPADLITRWNGFGLRMPGLSAVPVPRGEGQSPVYN